MKLIHISDLHIGEKKEHPEVIEKLIEEVNSAHPEAIFITGDITDEGLLEEYEEAAAVIKKFKKTPYIVPGNHDARNDGLELFKSYFKKPPFVEYVESLGATTIGLNSTLPDTNEGMIGDQQMEWLKNQLQKAKGSKVLCMHHHVLPVPHTGRERNVLYDAGDLLQLAKNNKVNLILSGHKHQHHVWILDNIIVSNAGTAFANRLLLRNRHSYNIVTIEEDHITIELKEIGFPAKPLLHFKQRS